MSSVVLGMLAGQAVERCDSRAWASESGVPVFEVIARLGVPDQAKFPQYQAVRSVALHLPLVYVLHRTGELAIYVVGESGHRDEQLPADRLMPEEIGPCRIIPDVGDGNDLKIVRDVLICTRSGQLEVYSLKDPGHPRHVARVGPEKRRRFSSSLVIHDKLGFVLAKDGILTYDLSAPAEPRFLGITDTDGHGWSRVGCGLDHHLYIGGRSSAGTGITVYDISDPAHLKRVGFVATKRMPYHLFALPDKRLVECEDSDAWVRFGTGIHGHAALYDLKDPTRPRRISERDRAGGRAAALLRLRDRWFLVCDGGILGIEKDGLKDVHSYVSAGMTLDGLPYHGDSAGGCAALALDRVTVVIGPRRIPLAQILYGILRVARLFVPMSWAVTPDP
jgi:hypothetical protein